MSGHPLENDPYSNRLLARVLLYPDDVAIGDRRRPLNGATVTELAASIEKIGQLIPIAVRKEGDGYALVAGHHRLEACRRLDLSVAAVVLNDDCDARLWEIAENLHRADLTALERAEHIAEWIKLTDGRVVQQPGQLDRAVKPHGHAQAGSGLSAAVRELGIDRMEGRRSVQIASIPTEVREAAREAGLADNQSALLTLARTPEPDRLAKVAEISARRAAPTPEPDVRKAAIAEAASIITDHVPPLLVTRLKALLATVTTAQLIKELV